jgi:hypothetical protein
MKIGNVKEKTLKEVNDIWIMDVPGWAQLLFG